jgi:hypothetical protein
MTSLVFYSKDKGEVGAYGTKFIWTGTGQAFVPNYIMIDVLNNNLNDITEENMDKFIDEFIHGHGFTGVHVPVSGQWFHIGEFKITRNDTVPDPRTLEKLALIINKVYQAGGCTHIWLWGDDQRDQTPKSTKDGIMGRQDKLVLDMIAQKLGSLQGWTMGYGFDLWEWVTEEQLKDWHDYMWSKPNWGHLLGARSDKNKLNQISESMDYASYEYHKPGYDELVKMINERPHKPSFSEDRYRIRNNPPSKWPEKDYNAEETRQSLWHHTMAGGIAGIWGNLDGDGVYPNKEALKCFSIFWNDNDRFKKDMVIDNDHTNGYCLRALNKYYVFYKEDTDKLTYAFNGKVKRAVAVDTKKKYKEIVLGTLRPGDHVFNAPYISDWAISVQ